MKFFEILAELLFPSGRKCLSCGAQSADQILCPWCCHKITGRLGYSSCSLCGRYYPAPPGGEPGKGLCLQCRIEPPAFFARSVGPYTGQLKEIIYLYKYRGYRSLSEIFAKLLSDVFLRERVFSEIDWLIPVPVSRDKMLARGFNQAELLASKTGRILKLPVSDCLIRIRDTRSQSKTRGAARRENVRGAFALMDEPPKGNILLVDDIFTTGATAGECARVLLEAGARTVGTLTIAAGIQEKINN